MTTQEAKQYVKGHLSQRAIILQLAEEAAELASAANKLVRVMDGENPSPVSQEEAREHVLSEYGDVLNCIDLLITAEENLAVVDRRKKYVRWAERIQAALEGTGNE